ncbi:MAG: septum formation initiator family protein [Candidatus Azobacteroides sp.]|nr:septum formation initiator family protein [Candidatus Azobacteroides sp.]
MKFAALDFIKSIPSKVNKYVLTGIIFLIVTFLIGDSTIRQRYEYDRQISELENEIAKCRKDSAENMQKLEALKSDNESLERFAREKYLMTKPGEELFVIE